MAKLYISDLSPYGARLRIVMGLTGISNPIEAPPGGSGSAEMKAINPFGKVPTLVTDDGKILVESAALMEYLAEQKPSAGLIPEKAESRAVMRAIIQAHDLYALTAMAPIFKQMLNPPPDLDIVKSAYASVGESLATLTKLFGNGGFAVGDSITLADCAMVPFAFVAERLGGAFGLESPFVAQPRLAQWWATVQKVPAVASVLEHQTAAFARAFGPK